jgi:hypothetical protein
LSEENFSKICREIIEMDESIRFAGIANKMGSLITTIYQEGIIPLMTKEETSQYALRAVVRATTREDFEIKLGRLQYSLGKYEKLIRVTIPIPSITTTSDEDSKSKFYLLVTLDIGSDSTSIIERKILPHIELRKETLM